MKRKSENTSQHLVFAKLTRKSYAIFNSLKRVVKIARLSVDVCQESLLKIISVSHTFFRANTEELKDELSLNTELSETFLSFFLIQQAVLVPINSKEIDKNYLKENILNQSPLFAQSDNGLFHFSYL